MGVGSSIALFAVEESARRARHVGNLVPGFQGEEDPWLSNFQDNPLEFFSQYNIRLHGKHLAQVRRLTDTLPRELAELQQESEKLLADDPARKNLQKTIDEKKQQLDAVTQAIKSGNPDKFKSLSVNEKSLHQKAFVTNINDPDYHSLEEIVYEDEGVKRNFKIPKGDLLHQFREDVNSGNLPAVSWLAAPK